MDNNIYLYTMRKLNALQEEREKERRKEELKLIFLRSLIITLTVGIVGKLFRK